MGRTLGRTLGGTLGRTLGRTLGGTLGGVMLMMPIMGLMWLWLRTLTLNWSISVTVGTILVTGDYAIWTAPVFHSGTPVRSRRVVRAVMTTPGIGLILAFGRIQSEHVQQNGGDIRHHDEWNEHDEPRKNGEPADAQLIQQNCENDHNNYLQKCAVLLSSKQINDDLNYRKTEIQHCWRTQRIYQHDSNLKISGMCKSI